RERWKRRPTPGWATISGRAGRITRCVELGLPSGHPGRSSIWKSACLSIIRPAAVRLLPVLTVVLGLGWPRLRGRGAAGRRLSRGCLEGLEGAHLEPPLMLRRGTRLVRIYPVRVPALPADAPWRLVVG